MDFGLTVDPPQSRSTSGRSAPRPPQTRSFRPNFWDVPSLVLGRSAPIKLHQILTEVRNNDDTPWAIAVGWIGNSNGMNVQHAPASSRLTPVEWADLWRHPSSMSQSTQQWSRLNVWSNVLTGVNSPTHCWQTPCNGFRKCHIQSTCQLPLYIWRRHADMRRVKVKIDRPIGNIRLKKTAVLTIRVGFFLLATDVATCVFVSFMPAIHWTIALLWEQVV